MKRVQLAAVAVAVILAAPIATPAFASCKDGIEKASQRLVAISEKKTVLETVENALAKAKAMSDAGNEKACEAILAKANAVIDKWQ